MGIGHYMVCYSVSIVSFGYRFAEANLLFPVFIIQLIMLFLTVWMISLFIIDKNKK
jgi:hypothetical protein